MCIKQYAKSTNILIMYQRTLAFGCFSSGPDPRVREREIGSKLSEIEDQNSLDQLLASKSHC